MDMTEATRQGLVPRHADGCHLDAEAEPALLTRTTGDPAPGEPARTTLVLNDTALALWELCDGQTSVQEMVDAVCALFAGPPERLRADVLDALDRLTDSGMLVWSVRLG
ncbi:MAG: PqqD family protein [Actinomycetes bacterium]